MNTIEAPEMVFNEGPVTLYRGDCREVMALLPDASVDSIVTDPPYELGFMGKGWDSSGIAYDAEVWAQAFRVLKPGGHALVFGGTRTWHRVAVAIEDAGFEIRDSFAWMYGSGFPKSMDVSKAIDAAAGAERVGTGDYGRLSPMDQTRERNGFGGVSVDLTPRQREDVAATPDAERWQGWGTAVKPAFEPVVVARKPLAGTVAANVLAHGTGALNIDASRIPMTSTDRDAARVPMRAASPAKVGTPAARAAEYFAPEPGGRFPSNVLLDESQAAELDKQSGVLSSGTMRAGTRRQSPGSPVYGRQQDLATSGDTYGDSGGASRFFYVAKAGKDERPVVDGHQHATVKPLALMRYLVRMVTQPGGTVLEPFAGSGTTLEACVIEGFNVIGAELDSDGTHIPLILKRLAKPHQQTLFGDVA